MELGLDDEEPRVADGFRSLTTAQCDVRAGRVTLHTGGAVLHRALSIGISCPETSQHVQSRVLRTSCDPIPGKDRISRLKSEIGN